MSGIVKLERGMTLNLLDYLLFTQAWHLFALMISENVYLPHLTFPSKELKHGLRKIKYVCCDVRVVHVVFC